MTTMTRSRKLPFGASWWPEGCPKPDSKGWDNLPWPTKMPILTDKDVCKNHTIPLEEPPYNLDGWLESVFGRYEAGDNKALWVEYVAGIVVEVTIEEFTGKRMASWEYFYQKDVTPAEVALVWNHAMDLLGYKMTNSKKPTGPINVDTGDEDYFS